MTETQLEVHVDTRRHGTLLAGTAYFTRDRRDVTTVFDYASSYLRTEGVGSIDPSLPLMRGGQYVARLPGAFGDSAPDRWGRNLISRRERNAAREQRRRARELDDVDFLLGVSDHTRQGAIRYRHPGDPAGVFLGTATDVPRLIALPRLLRASDQAVEGADDAAAVKALLDAGTGSLGGARPKAAVTLDDGRLGIAKFPHAQDGWDVMAWEAASLDLAERAGLPVPGHTLHLVGDRHVLLLDRFDRDSRGHRCGYMSAMTAVGSSDGADNDYEDVCDALPDLSFALRDDRASLFRRAVFSVALHNTDDHLRNLGFLNTAKGWHLSPVFDVNPNPDAAATRRTSLAGAVRLEDEPDALLIFAERCDLALAASREHIAAVVDAVAGWKHAATANRVPRRDSDTVGAVIEETLSGLRRLLPAPR